MLMADRSRRKRREGYLVSRCRRSLLVLVLLFILSLIALLTQRRASAVDPTTSDKPCRNLTLDPATFSTSALLAPNTEWLWLTELVNSLISLNQPPAARLQNLSLEIRVLFWRLSHDAQEPQQTDPRNRNRRRTADEVDALRLNAQTLSLAGTRVGSSASQFQPHAVMRTLLQATQSCQPSCCIILGQYAGCDQR